MAEYYYRVVFVLDDGTTVVRTKPDAKSTIGLMTHYPPKRAVYVTRYYPSCKGWRVFDLRRRTDYWRGGTRFKMLPKASAVLETEDAAVMWAGLNLGI